MVNWRTRWMVFVLLVLTVGATAEEQVHVLERGETIYTLARRYEISADAILRYNEIADPTRLAVGTRIRIPGTYVVQSGEYVFMIAERLGVDWLDLLAANGLDRDDVVRPGDVLLVPAGSRRAIAVSSEPAGERDTSSDQPGEDSVAVSSERAEPDGADVGPRTGGADSGGVPAGDRTERGSATATSSVDAWPHPGERQVWDGKFPGVVMRGSVGDEFLSVSPGVVEYVGPFSSFGKLILVRGRNGYLYGYAGADRVLVSRGERVERGSLLGTVGFSPAFDSAMVLFTVWRNNRYVDPETAPRG